MNKEKTEQTTINKCGSCEKLNTCSQINYIDNYKENFCNKEKEMVSK